MPNKQSSDISNAPSSKINTTDGNKVCAAVASTTSKANLLQNALNAFDKAIEVG